VSAHPQCAPGPIRPKHEVADIFRAHGETYRDTHVLTPEQRKVMWAIENCRTAVLGGHVDLCLDCGHEQPAYNSCRNRHCPKCQALDQARWLEKRKQYILPTHYFHVVLTLPTELHPLTRRNPKLIYGLLFAAASQSMLSLGRDPKHLGGLLAITAVLHTWTKDLRFHPHIHCVVTGGGLSTDRQRWVDSGPNFLVPYKVLSRLFRGKFIDGLCQLYAQAKLALPTELSKPAAFEQLRRTLFKKDWVVYLKPPFAGPEQVFRYLARYTHRVAISNNRILAVTDDNVTIATKNDNSVTLTAEVFIRRFLQHILPKGFCKIRHFGLMAPYHLNASLPIAKLLLGGAPKLTESEPAAPEPHVAPNGEQWQELMLELTGIDLTRCPICDSVRITRLPITPPNPADLLPSPQRGPPRGAVS